MNPLQQQFFNGYYRSRSQFTARRFERMPALSTYARVNHSAQAQITSRYQGIWEHAAGLMPRLFVVAGLLLTAACAGLGPSKSPEALVAERAQIHAQALMEGKWEEALAMTTPGYRATTQPGLYRLKYGGVGSWTGVAVAKVECDMPINNKVERCEAHMNVTYFMRAPSLPTDLQGTRRFRKIWIQTSGDWYLVE